MRVFSSTFALILILLIAFDWFVSHARPLRWVNHTGLTAISQNSVVSKLPDIMISQVNKDILLLGSSLVLVPSVRCDDKLNGVKTRYDHWYFRNHINEHAQADYLEHQLNSKLQDKVSICNAAIAASVVSDSYLIAEKYLGTGKKPKLAIICVAPREFLDNGRAQIEKNPTYSILADFSSLPDLLKKKADFAAVAETAVGLGWQYFRHRSDYKSFLCNLTSRVTGQPVSEKDDRPVAAKPRTLKDERVLESQREVVYDQPPNMLYDIPGYKKMYLPINETQWQNQTAYFHRLLALLQQNNVPVLIVDMPVTQENYALLPESVLSRYKSFLAKTAPLYNARLFALADEQKFDTKSEFEDSAHMNAAGGDRLFTAIAGFIAESEHLASALRPQTQHVATTRKHDF